MPIKSPARESMTSRQIPSCSGVRYEGASGIFCKLVGCSVLTVSDAVDALPLTPILFPKLHFYKNKGSRSVSQPADLGLCHPLPRMPMMLWIGWDAILRCASPSLDAFVVCRLEPMAFVAQPLAVVLRLATTID